MSDRNRRRGGTSEDIPEEQFEDMESGYEGYEEAADLNAYATGDIDMPEEYGTRKPKKRGGLFGRKKKNRQPDFDESEESVYGVQLKPLSEYRKGFNPVTGEFDLGEAGYADLFDDSKKAIDDEVAQNFKRLQRERRSRVAEAVQHVGMDEKEIADELGIVAPMPVSSFSADPYTKQHGLDPQGAGSDEDIQRAMLDSAGRDTMEIKLNVDRGSIELQRGEVEQPPEEKPQPTRMSPEDRPSASPAGGRQRASRPRLQAAKAPAEESMPTATKDTVPVEGSPVLKQANDSGAAPGNQETIPVPEEVQGEKIIEGRPRVELPQVESIYEYRTRGIPTHVINADLLQKAILTEAGEVTSPESVQQPREEISNIPIRRQARRQVIEPQEFENIDSGHNDEMIEDYTGADDASSIANELRGDMRDLTFRMLISGICTVALTLVNLIFGGQFAGLEEAGSTPLIYIIITTVFLGITLFFCRRTIFNGLRALFSFSANSDSAVAIASIGILVQTVASIFFTSEVVSGGIHLYAVILTGIFFVNAAGKITMIRRIHSNFRFVNSHEQKYAVKVFGDHNTAIKMIENSPTDKPVLTYQVKTGFLKRFLELSYSPDPAETSSQMMAPLGLIASLVLCIVTLLLTNSVPVALSALAASLCVCVATSNMLTVNLPMSRLCKRARRAGAMVVGYEGVAGVAETNAVMMDAEEIFPFGTIVLNGIKTYGNKALAEEAIIAASALMNAAGGPLRGVFEQVISENEEILPEVESFEYEEEKGIIGRVDGKRIFIGNRNLLVNNHLEPPARSDETPYASGNNQVIYIAMDADVSAMMVLTYSADRRRKNELQRLEDDGIGIVVRTLDPNLTPTFISRVFGLEISSVSVLGSELGEVYHRLVREEVPRSDATIATKGRIESLMNIIAACVGMKRGINSLIIVQNAAIILGFILVAFLACFGAMKALSSLLLFIFVFFWVALIIIIPKIRKM